MDEKEAAIRSLRVAEYMLENTYPTVQDPKLLLAIIDDIFISLTHLMKHFIKNKKDIPSLFESFKAISKSHGFSDEDLNFILKMKKILQDHKDSKVEFTRKDKFIICLEHYKLEPIGVEEVKAYIFKAKYLLRRLEHE
ncbi:hypothetical protein ACFL0V_06555 [Nanoarchaeota archaeon]